MKMVRIAKGMRWLIPKGNCHSKTSKISSFITIFYVFFFYIIPLLPHFLHLFEIAIIVRKFRNILCCIFMLNKDSWKIYILNITYIIRKLLKRNWSSKIAKISSFVITFFIIIFYIIFQIFYFQLTYLLLLKIFETFCDVFIT